MPITLVFSDVTPLAFPFQTSIASAVVSTYGPTFVKDIVANRAIIVVDKLTNEPSTASSHAFARNPDSSVTEIARTNYGLDAAASKGTYSVQCLRVDPVTSTSTIESVLEANHESFTVTSTSSTDTTQENSSNLSFLGLSFSTDDASVSFGANQEFRIRYGAGEGPNGTNLLVMESKNSTTGLYVVKSSISDA